MKVEQKAVKDYMNQRGWTYLNRSIPFREVRTMLTEFAEQQVKLLVTPAVSVAKHPLPRPLEAWKNARNMELSEYIEWHLEQERRGNAR